MLKFELDEYSPLVLRHIGNALVAIAADRESERGKDVVDKADCDVHPEVVAFTPPPSVVAPFSPELTVPPAPPVGVVETYETASPVLPPVEDDDGFPDPPAPKIPEPPAVVPAPPSLPDLDSAGIPWDARIHAATKTKCKDGTWKNKPGVDPALLTSVTAELKGVQALPVPPAPVATVPPAPAATAGPTIFAELVAAVGPLVAPGGKLTPDQVNAVCQAQGLPNLGALGARPDLIPTVWSQICLILG